MRFYYYTSDPVDTFDGPWDAGATQVTLPSGRTISRLTVAIPEWGVYEAIEDTTPNPAYHVRADPFVTLAFVGVEGLSSARVHETRHYDPISIADLYDRKRREIGDHDGFVRFNAIDTSLSGAWWIVATERTRFYIEGVQGSWLQRQIDGQGWPQGQNAPWVLIYNANNQRVDLVQISDDTNPPSTGEALWRTIYDEKTMHDQQCSVATDASDSALTAIYDAGNGIWQDVADHDPADPQWGYPPVVELPPGVRSMTG